MILKCCWGHGVLQYSLCILQWNIKNMDILMKYITCTTLEWKFTFPASRLLARSLLTWDSAMSARSWASSSSCWTFLSLEMWVLPCSSCDRIQRCCYRKVKDGIIYSKIIGHINVGDVQLPQPASCKPWLWAAICLPDPGVCSHSSCPPQSAQIKQEIYKTESISWRICLQGLFGIVML